MKITSVRQGVVPINSAIANAYIDFSKMTASVVAITVESGDGRSATGYGFNSNGRYAQPGLLAERFIPRLEEGADLIDQEHAPRGGYAQGSRLASPAPSMPMPMAASTRRPPGRR